MTSQMSNTVQQYYTAQEIQAGLVDYAIQTVHYWNGDFPAFEHRFINSLVWLRFADEMIHPFMNALAGRPAGPLPQHQMRILPDGPAFESRIDVINAEGQAIHNINYGSLTKIPLSEVDSLLFAAKESGQDKNTPHYYCLKFYNEIRELAHDTYVFHDSEKPYHFMRAILGLLDNGYDDTASIILTASHTADTKEILMARGETYVRDNTRYSGIGTTLTDQFDYQYSQL